MEKAHISSFSKALLCIMLSPRYEETQEETQEGQSSFLMSPRGALCTNDRPAPVYIVRDTSLKLLSNLDMLQICHTGS